MKAQQVRDQHRMRSYILYNAIAYDKKDDARKPWIRNVSLYYSITLVKIGPFRMWLNMNKLRVYKIRDGRLASDRSFRNINITSLYLQLRYTQLMPVRRSTLQYLIHVPWELMAEHYIVGRVGIPVRPSAISRSIKMTGLYYEKGINGFF